MDLLNFLNNLLIYLSNGVLSLFYLLAKVVPALLSLACGLVLILTLDKDVQGRANYKPSRYSPMGFDQAGRRDGSSLQGTTETPRTAQVLKIGRAHV